MPKRSRHRVSEGQDARSERPAMGMGSPEPGANREHTQVDDLCYEGAWSELVGPRRALETPALGDRRGLDLRGERGPVHRPRSSGTGAGHTVRRMIVAVMP